MAKERAQLTRLESVFTLKLDEAVSLGMLVEFVQDIFPAAAETSIWPADDGELVVSVRGDGAIAAT